MRCWRHTALVVLVVGVWTGVARADLNGDLQDAMDPFDPAKAEAVLERGADVNTMKGGYSPMDAAADGHRSEEAVKFLISRGADVNRQDQDGSSPLLHACNTDHAGAVRLLLAAGANPNKGSKFDRFPLMYACDKGDEAIVAMLLENHADPNATCSAGPALIWALLSPKQDLKFDIVKLLMNHGARPEMTAAAGARNSLAGSNAITASLFRGDLAITDYLLTKGGDVNAPDASGMTPLMWVSSWGKTDLITHFLSKGADVSRATAAGDTALTYAGDRGYVEAMQLLEDHGAKREELHIVGWPAAAGLSAAQKWGLAMGAVYAQLYGENPHVLGGQNTETPEQTKAILAGSWSIHGDADLRKQLDDLLQGGHHLAYYNAGRRLAEMSYPEYFLDQYIYWTPKSGDAADRLRKAYEKWQKKDGVAWDLSRYVYLVNAGISCHYLNEAESWERLNEAAKVAQQTFGSWDEFADNYLDGRELWARKRDPRYDLVVQLLTNQDDPHSPWNENSWGVDLTR